MDFSEVLQELKSGRKAYRSGWNGIKLGRDMFVYLQNFEEYEDCFILENEGAKQPGWMPSIMDILAEDWKYKLGD